MLCCLVLEYTDWTIWSVGGGTPAKWDTFLVNACNLKYKHYRLKNNKKQTSILNNPTKVKQGLKCTKVHQSNSITVRCKRVNSLFFRHNEIIYYLPKQKIGAVEFLQPLPLLHKLITITTIMIITILSHTPILFLVSYL